MRSAIDPEALVRLAATMFGPLDEVELPETGEMRLNIGSYAAAFPPSAWLARRVFMATVASLAPLAMEDLLQRLQQLVDRHKDYFQGQEPSGREWTRDEYRDHLTRQLQNSVDFEWSQTGSSDFDQDSFASTSEWMAVWHLGDDQHSYFVWIGLLDVLNQMYGMNDLRPMYILSLYLAHPEALEMFLPGGLAELPKDWEATFPNWTPTLEHRSDYEARARAEFERQLATQLDSTCKLAEEAGLTPTATKRNGVLHFRWLVRFQVLEESFGSIARSECVSYKTVSEAVKRTAEAIDLPLRQPSRAGRKPHPIPAAHPANSG